jgi:hypothetical protein
MRQKSTPVRTVVNLTYIDGGLIKWVLWFKGPLYKISFAPLIPCNNTIWLTNCRSITNLKANDIHSGKYI